MKAKSKKVHPKLLQLQKNVGGTIDTEDGELYYGPPGKQIFIHTPDCTKFVLWSQRPLYTVKDGRARLTRQRICDGEPWYSATVAAADVQDALKLARAKSDPEFAYESFLHHYCARQLSDVEDGLTLYQKGRLSGLEVSVSGRFIDILAVDSSGGLVVIELKRSRGYQEVMTQLLGYMGWIRKHLAKPSQRVRGIIIARQITEDLRLAASAHPDIKLKEYVLSVSIEDA